MTEHPKVYLFDLDGTLLDSAPDLAAAANHMRVVRGLEPLPFATLRKTASSGARGLLGAAFGIRPEDAGYAEMAKEFLDYYEEHMADHSRLFDGVPEMLQDIEAQGARWGIITNKHARFVHPLIKFHMLEPAVVVEARQRGAERAAHLRVVHEVVGERCLVGGRAHQCKSVGSYLRR